MSRESRGPIKPEPKPVSLQGATTAIAVLDLTVRCDDPAQVCTKLLGGLRVFLDRARVAGASIVYTGSYADHGTPRAEVAKGLHSRSDELVLYPNGFDKFTGGEFQKFLTEHRTRNLVIAGSSTHVAVMYTATAAARNYGYNVIIPLDGVNTANAYEHEYALHQLCVIPGGAADRIQFSTLPNIQFT